MIEKAAAIVQEADALLVCAGAGMGVDSGLPDFRGNEGFWKAYPPLAKLGVSFAEIANPEWFHSDPELAWGFYGHRVNLYRETVPHVGFALLQEWAKGKRFGAFAYTSNVDGHFQKAGFAENRVVECHGSLQHLQCLYNCSWNIWPMEEAVVSVEMETLRAEGALPRCPGCGRIARPNVLMFNDWNWMHTRSDSQASHMETWLSDIVDSDAKLAIIEIGAGNAIPTVRLMAERVADVVGTPLIRINPRSASVPRGVGVSLPLGGLEALQKIAAALGDPS